MNPRIITEAIVLAGGFGTRLAHVVQDVCKPMAPVAGRPFLRFILDDLADNEFTRVIIADGYKREQIEHYFGDSYRGMHLIYSSEDEPLGTGGAIRQAFEHVSSEWAFVLNGDTFCEVNYQQMEETILSINSNIASEYPGNIVIGMAVKFLDSFDRYGSLEISEEGYINAFFEKSHTVSAFINAGVYLFNRTIFNDAPNKFSLEKDIFENIADGKTLMTIPVEGTFIDIGIPEDYELAQTLLNDKVKTWKLALFDRDGTINIDTGHLFEPDKLILIPETLTLLKNYSLNPDYKVVVVTNQAGIAKGLYTEQDMRQLHRYLDTVLLLHGIKVDAYYFCPHHPEFTGLCECRKPASGMILKALFDFDASAKDAIMYGDTKNDEQAANGAEVTFEYIQDYISK